LRLDPRERKCDLCGHEGPEILWERRKGSIARCPKCGLVFTVLSEGMDPRSVYERGPFSAPEDGPKRLAIWRGRLGMLLGYGTGGRILDVGCGKGGFLREARRAGLLAVGVDISEREATTARLASGAEVAVADACALPFSNGSFDMVSMWNVLEHLVSPKGALLEARRVLKDGGLLVVSVPNMSPPFGLFSPFLKRKSGRWGLFKFEESGHLYHFSRRTLSLYLARTGFSVLKLWAGEVPLKSRALTGVPTHLRKALERALGAGSPLVALARKEG